MKIKIISIPQNARKWNHKHEFGGPNNPWEIGYLYDKGIAAPAEQPLYSLPLVPYRQRVLREPTISSPRELSEVKIQAPKEDMAHMPSMIQPEVMPEPTKIDYNLGRLNDVIDSTDSNFNLENLRYAPAIGSGIGALVAALQPTDYTLANEYRNLASRLNPVASPHIGGYRRYTPYDINLGDAENLALEATALRASRGQNRATQAAQNIATINAFQKADVQRNLAAQQANEANRLAVDTYNLGIDQFNAQRDTQYDQLNQQILNNRLNMLAQAAQAADASRTARANMINTTGTNFFNQLGNIGQDEWNRNQFLAWIQQHPATAKAMGY